MKSLIVLFLLCALASPAAVKVVLVGDSTVNDEGGWGPGFRTSFDAKDVTVVNLALNGRSTKSFRAEGAWSKALAEKPAYILIQFGHNDVPGKGPDRETDAGTTYRENLTRYVEEARAIGATPILVTSIVRRNFDGNGRFRPDSLVPYVDGVWAVANAKNVPVMDLYTLTRSQAEHLGSKGVLELNAVTKDGKTDSTHLGPKGQREIGIFAAREFIRIVPEMEAHVAKVRWVVAQDGTGDAKTIQYAIDHAPAVSGMQRLILEIRPGTYKERIVVPQDRPRLTLLGNDAATTVITAAMSAREAGGTFLSSTVDVEGTEFQAENITFENTFGVGSQAVAIKVHSDRAEFRKCRFLGWQDTVYAATGRQYYKDCLIEGHVDFIFGNATAVFENCEIRSRGAGYITAHSRTDPAGTTGFVFDHCRLTANEAGRAVYLGRPWRPYARVVFLDSDIGAHIRPEGWENWGNPENEKTAWYGEFGSTGAGASAGPRARWAHALSSDEAAAFRADVFLQGGDGWKPSRH